jgi:hypothetical protein
MLLNNEKERKKWREREREDVNGMSWEKHKLFI